MKSSFSLTMLFLCLCGLVLLSQGCKDKHKPAPKPEERRPVTKRDKAPATRTTKATPKAASAWYVAGYEKIRVALAADDMKATTAGATALATAATAHAKGPQAEAFKGMAAAATKVANTKDFAAARLAFGALSKQVITVLTKSPAQAKGITTYFCPMAKGYKKWIQADKDMANPYMGKRMLKCGGKTKLAI